MGAAEHAREEERMDVERQKLVSLERQIDDVSAKLDECEVRSLEEELMAHLAWLHESLDAQRKLFDDLEFQQLEVCYCHLLLPWFTFSTLFCCTSMIVDFLLSSVLFIFREKQN